MGRTFAVGDIHGMSESLNKVLAQSGFDYENDTLISLGDVVDRGPDSCQCIETLLQIKNLIAIKGNHDDWWKECLITGIHPVNMSHGGHNTLISYGNIDPTVHLPFFNKQITHYIDDQNRLFVHAGFKTDEPFDQQNPTNYYWNRDLWARALSYKNRGMADFPYSLPFKEIYIGHTPTINEGTNKPINCYNIWNLDTGACFVNEGKLTLMNIDTKVYYQA